MLVVVPQEEEQLSVTTAVTANGCGSGNSNKDKKDIAHVSPIEKIVASHRLPFKKRLKELKLMQEQQQSTDPTNPSS